MHAPLRRARTYGVPALIALAASFAFDFGYVTTIVARQKSQHKSLLPAPRRFGSEATAAIADHAPRDAGLGLD
jgi:hypothetical protein